MQTERQIDPRHRETRSVLRVLGPLVAIVGLILIAIALINFFAFDSFGPPRYQWCAFIGMPLLFVGLVLTGMGFMGAVARYQAGEVAPVARDTFNYLAEGTSDGVRTVARAVGEGFGSGMAGAAGVEGGAGGGTVVRCHKCNGENPVDAKFCNDCGAALGKTRPCPMCDELNDPDAKFCDNCGRRFD